MPESTYSQRKGDVKHAVYQGGYVQPPLSLLFLNSQIGAGH